MFTSDDRYGFADNQQFDIAQYTRPRGRVVKKLGYTTDRYAKLQNYIFSLRGGVCCACDVPN